MGRNNTNDNDGPTKKSGGGVQRRPKAASLANNTLPMPTGTRRRTKQQKTNKKPKSDDDDDDDGNDAANDDSNVRPHATRTAQRIPSWWSRTHMTETTTATQQSWASAWACLFASLVISFFLLLPLWLQSTSTTPTPTSGSKRTLFSDAIRAAAVQQQRRRRQSLYKQNDVPLLLHTWNRGVQRPFAPFPQGHDGEKEEDGRRRRRSDYGDLTHLDFLEVGGGARNIMKGRQSREPVWKWVEYRDDDDDGDLPYYAFDDDVVRHETCRRVAWHWDSHVNCNSLHEMHIVTQMTKYLGQGYWRDAIAMTVGAGANGQQKVVLKMLQYHHEVRTDTMEFVRMDALVTETLYASHPQNVVGIYGFCGSSVVAEFMPGGTVEPHVVPYEEGDYGDLEDAETGQVLPQNDLSPREKLEWAWQMSRALAVVHGYSQGMILHGDVQISQFLLDAAGQIKINDFNRAEVMIWNEEEQAYCTFQNGEAYGLYRAPEEHQDAGLTQQMEVWSMGILFYMLVTGLHPYHEVEDDDDRVFSSLVAQGKIPHLDPRFATRSEAEAVLVELMYDCWNMDPDARPSIFYLVERLERALDELLEDENDEEDDDDDEYEDEEEDFWQDEDEDHHDDDDEYEDAEYDDDYHDEEADIAENDDKD